MKSACLSLLFLSVLTGCQQSLKFEPQHYQAQSKDNCQPHEGCAKFNLDIVATTNKITVADSINNSVFKMIRRAMYVGENPQEAKNYLQLANCFVQTHEQIKKEFQERFKETPPSWEATGKCHVQWQSDKIVNMVLEYYAFTGGAHGYGAKLSQIFDAQTGKTIPNQQLFTDSLSVLNMVEEQFRKQYKIAPKTSLTEAGYFLPEDQFVFPKNIYYNAKGIVFHYNPYEIAAYVVGDIEVVLPYAKIDQYLRFK